MRSFVPSRRAYSFRKNLQLMIPQKQTSIPASDVAGADKGVSIGIGYMAETYIDFGALGMMPVLAAFGYFLGRIYRYFMTSSRSRGLLGMGLASAIISGAAKFETSISKILGGIIVMLLVSELLIRIVIPKYAPWVVEREGAKRRAV